MTNQTFLNIPGMSFFHLTLPSLKFQASEKIEGLDLLAAKKGKHEKEA